MGHSDRDLTIVRPAYLRATRLLSGTTIPTGRPSHGLSPSPPHNINASLCRNFIIGVPRNMPCHREPIIITTDTRNFRLNPSHELQRINLPGIKRFKMGRRGGSTFYNFAICAGEGSGFLDGIFLHENNTWRESRSTE